MAAKAGSVWAIDIGSNSLKALRLGVRGDAVEVIGFDDIQHGKILTGSGIKPVERDELVALSLRQFIKQNELGNDEVIISVPSQNSFARFVNLPPVEQKRIPEIVKFEATQQIPFDINDVQWDWQMISEPGSSAAKVGLFAVKSDVVTSMIEHFSGENIHINYVQMAPMALYNYLEYDRPEMVKSDNQATVIINIGAEITDLVVCTKSVVWQRCIQMGGNAFTKAIADAFKLNFEKAEKLKRTAPMSKYARQILQAMKPVFTDLASEIQRSLGFYTNSNPATKLVRIVAMGGGTKMRGLVSYLQQTLQIPIERPDAFKKLAINPAVSAAKFHEGVCDFGIVYGLALQGLGLAKLENNLLPRSVARSMAWAGKAKYFTAGALALLVVSLMCFGRAIYDKARYSERYDIRQKVQSVIRTAEQAKSELEAQKAKEPAFEAIIQKELEPFKYRDILPLFYQTVLSTLPNGKNTPQQEELYRAFSNGDVDAILKTSRKERKQVFITGISVYFTQDIKRATFGAASFERERGGRKKAQESDVFVDYVVDDSMFGSAKRAPTSISARSKPEGTSAADTIDANQALSGFVVTVAGYSPYKDIAELMDPVGVGDDKAKWGIVTRMLHLGDVNGGGSPFILYKKAEIQHFKLEFGDVSLDNPAMPAGIGVETVKIQKPKSAKALVEQENILIDPLTNEVISKVADYDEDGRRKIDRAGKVVYKVNDHWFVLSAKFVWKDAPKESAQTDN